MKNKKYFPSPFLVIIALMVIFVFISWIGSTINNEIKSIGILDIFSSIWHGFVSKVDIIMFIFSIGGCLGIMTKVKAIDAGITAVVKKFKTKISLLIPILMFIFGLGGSTFGMWEETIAFIPIIVLVFKKTKFGPFVGLLVVLVGAGTGCLASTINPFSVGLVKDGKYIGTFITQGTRWLSFFVFELISISSVMFFAYKVKNRKIIITGLNQEVIEHRFSSLKLVEVKFTIKRKITLFLFALTFILMIILYLPWNSWFSNLEDSQNSFFSKYFWWFATTEGIKTFDSSPCFANLGAWTFLSVSSLFLISTILIFIINFKDFKTNKNHNAEQEFLKTYMDGISDVLSVCLVIAVAGGLGLILKQTGIGKCIADQLGKIVSSWVSFGIGVFILSILLSFLVPSSSGFATSFMPIFMSVAIKLFPGHENTAIGIAILGFIFANGIVNLVSPTSAALMGYTTYVGIPYNVWIKYIWKIILILFLTGLILIIIFSCLAANGSALF